MNELKFIIKKPQRDPENDYYIQTLAIVAQYPHYRYPIQLNNNLDLDLQLHKAMNELKLRLIADILKADFEFEKGE